MGALRHIDTNTDVDQDLKTGQFYLLQYRHIEPWDTRSSRRQYNSHDEAIWAYLHGKVTWTRWD